MRKIYLAVLISLSSIILIAQNDITGVNLNVHTTFHNVGVQINYTGDVDSNAIATLEANINNTGFQPMHKMSRVYQSSFVGTIFNLAPQTSVDVRVTLSDPSGVTNPIHTASISTRDETIPLPGITEIHVAKTGSDVSGDGSIANPYLTIQKAIDNVAFGNTIIIHEGNYHEQTTIAYLNPPTNMPITIKSAANETVVLTGTDSTYNDINVWTNEGNNIYSTPLSGGTYYIGFDGNRMWRYDALAQLTSLPYNTDGGFYNDLSNNKAYARFPGNASPSGHTISLSTKHFGFEIFESSNFVIDGLNFTNFNSEEHSGSIRIGDSTIGFWVVNNTFENTETAVRLEGYVENLAVMNNEFSDQGVNVFEWDFVKEYQWWLERGALYITNDGYTGQGIIFYNNYVHDMFDGVKIVGSEDDFTAYPTNSEVINNTFNHLSDDGVEVDGFACNIRIMNNEFTNLLAGVSVAPAIAGPVYIIRNTMADLNNVASPNWETTAVKFSYDGERSGEIFIYHNTGATSELNQAALSITNDANWQKLTFRNNIWQGTEWGFYHWLDNTAQLVLEHDYDLVYSTNSNYLVLFDGIEYSTLSDYTTAVEHCENCEEGNPLFVNYLLGDYHLTTPSPAIDKGILIQGINDDFIDASPDMGRYEYGQTLALNESEILKIKAYPNPTSGVLLIEGMSIFSYEIYDVNGQLIKANSYQNMIDLTDLSTGLYIINIFDNSSKSISNIKVIKE